jgi:steroid 5-alpha reductase family enzyme
MYMTAWFLVAKKRKRFDPVDSAWGGAFALVAWAVALQQPSTRTLMVAALVTLWSGRLTSHLAKRSRKRADDPRYVAMAANWKRVWLRAYFSIFLVQGLIVWIISLPIVMNAGMVLPALNWLFTFGYIVWVVGFFIEYKADRQLAEFLADPANKGKVLDTGLWHGSRHPNYFGELLQWWGIGLIACQTSFGWICLIGPLLLTFLIIFVSGIPPIEKRRAKDMKYQAYMKRTSPLIPWFPSEK